MSSLGSSTRLGLLVAAVLLGALLFPATVGAQTSEFKVSTSSKGARFKVDGQTYVSEAIFNWPPGSKHVLEFPISVDLGGYQFSPLFNARYTFGGWSDNLGLLVPSSELVQVVTADPTIESYVANVTVEFLVRVVWFDTLPTPPVDATAVSPSACGAPGNPVPLEFRIGVIYIDGVCYWNNVELWMAEGTHTLNAFPYPGYVFIGWKADVSPPNAFLRTFEITGPLSLVPRFSPAKRVNFRTEPPGMAVRVDGTAIRTTDIEPCEPNNVLPPGAPLTSKPMCTGEFDFAPDSRHVIGAPSPQVDRYGRTWVFIGFSNGMGQDAVYITSPTVWPEDTLLGRFVRGTRVSLTTKPPGLGLSVDGEAASSVNNYVYAPGGRHTVTAPAEQVDARGRRYRFKGWSNGGPATQEFVVPDTIDMTFQLEAEYELLNRLMITSNVAGGAVLVDGEQCEVPCTVDRPRGANVTLEAPSTQLAGDGRRLEFERWSDGQSRVRSLAIPAADPPALQVFYATAYVLRLAIDPEEGGQISVTPASPDNYYREATKVFLTAQPAEGYRFRRWDYDAQGTDPAAVVIMSAARSVAARFDKINSMPPLTIRNAAGGDNNVVAAGSLISIFGTNLAPRYEVGPTGPILAQALAGVSVVVEDRILPLLFVSPEQINAQLPRDLAPGDYELRVIRAGALTQRGKFRVERTAPGLFSHLVDLEHYAVAQHEEGGAVSLASPARAGELVTLSATGLGPYRITIREGLALPAVPLYPLDAVVELYAGETPLPLEWAGGHPGQVGMDLIRFRIPEALEGAAALSVTVKSEGRTSNTVIIPVQ